jgi:transposase
MTKSTKNKPKQYTPTEKVAILRQHLVDQQSVSEICREQQLHPNVFYRWQKIFFDGGAAAFEPSASAQVTRLNREIDDLNAQLVRKNEVLAEVMEAYVALKKSVGAR